MRPGSPEPVPVGWSGDLDAVFESFRYDLGERHDEVTIECSRNAGERVESVAGAAAFSESQDPCRDACTWSLLLFESWVPSRPDLLRALT